MHMEENDSFSSSCKTAIHITIKISNKGFDAIYDSYYFAVYSVSSYLKEYLSTTTCMTKMKDYNLSSWIMCKNNDK